MRFKPLFIVILSIFSATVFAQAMPGNAVKIHADNMYHFSKDNLSKFVGNVVASSETYTLTADNLDVQVITENEVKYNNLVSKGNVNFKSADILAVANNAQLNQKDKTIHLDGAVKIWQNDNYLEGEDVLIHYETKEIYVDKGAKDRVTVIFNPEETE